MDGFVAGAIPHRYWEIQGDQVDQIDGGVIEETMVDVYVNGQELATLMCSPLDQEALAVGFLYTEGVIDSAADVGLVKANLPGTVVDVLLTTTEVRLPRRLVLTSGCGGGITLQYLTESYPALQSDYVTTTELILQRMRDLQGAAVLYNLVRGVHTAILADSDGLLVSAEDVGRHNAIDKIAGKALLAGVNTRDCMLLASGRISSEMLSKARRMEIPVVVSRTAPTSTAIKLAEAWQICVVGYVRRGSMRVYTQPQRLGLVDATESNQTISVADPG